ncbi:NAD(P)-dependent oxidoreductase [Gynuella sp.]|uniref:NAD(P)-dependent oxidoreductase n=1 Tax=Gynuella sp. TaxID=2969146 RepID=UPI003D0FD55C
MKKIFITAEVPARILQNLSREFQVDVFSQSRPMTEQELLHCLECEHYDAVVCTYKDRINQRLLDAAGEQLQVIATLSNGTDHIDKRACHQAGVKVCNVPAVTTHAVADYAVALLLIGIRRLDNHIQEDTYDGHDEPWHFMGNLQGRALSDMTIGIVGMGKIGTEISRRLHGFGARIHYFSRTRKIHVEQQFAAQYQPLDTLLASTDAILLSCALSQETYHLLNRNTLRNLKPHTILVNVARGEICDHQALTEVLASGQLAMLLTDTTEPEPLPAEHPLRQMSNCLIFPHIATNTLDSRENLCHSAVLQVQRTLSTLQKTNSS